MGSTWKTDPDVAPLRLGLVGCGRIAQSHLEALATVEDVELSAVAEIRETAGRAVAERFRCRHFLSHDDPEFRDAIDAVLICTPPSLHFSMAKHFLVSGIPVLCEKPLTLSSPEAEDLVRIGHDRDALLMMASKFRYVDDVIKAKSLIESGILGKIVMFENSFCARVPMEGRWNAQKEISGGGVLIDNGCHSVDIARYLLGPIGKVQAEFGPRTQDIEVEDSVRLQFRSESDAVGIIDLSWSINKESDSYISLFGTDGTLHVGWRGSRYRQEGSSRWTAFGSGYDKIGALSGQLTNFVRTIRGEEIPLITPQDSLASVRVIETAYASAASDHWLQVAS